MPKSLATLMKELTEYRRQLAESTAPWPRPPSTKPMNYILPADRLRPLIAKTEKEIENLKKKEQEKKEAQIAALNSTTLGQKLPEDVIRKVSEYGGKKRKTRKRKSRKTRKTRRA
jgi:hypothetical protein